MKPSPPEPSLDDILDQMDNNFAKKLMAYGVPEDIAKIAASATDKPSEEKDIQKVAEIIKSNYITKNLIKYCCSIFLYNNAGELLTQIESLLQTAENNILDVDSVKSIFDESLTEDDSDVYSTIATFDIDLATSLINQLISRPVLN